jgi:hypothetical protein
MKVVTKAALALLALGTSAAFIIAQDSSTPSSNGTPPAGAPPVGPPGANGPAPGRPGFRRQPPPIIAALDANHDGVIDEAEIANAPAALKTLDKNGDGKLTMDELMGPRPMRGGGPGGRPVPPPPPGDEPPPPPPPGDGN